MRHRVEAFSFVVFAFVLTSACSSNTPNVPDDAAADALAFDASTDVSKTGDAALEGSAQDASDASSPSGEAMPNGDLPGWTLIFSDDFLTDVPVGSFPNSAYAGWSAYPEPWTDTSKNGEYSPQKTLSVSKGVLDIRCHTESGVHYVSAPEPMNGKGQTYGRYAVRFRATQTTNDYKTAWLLWPDSEQWPDDGEIDFPEGQLADTIGAFAHHASPQGGQDAFSTKVLYTAWHTAVLEWSQGNVTFILDGVTIGVSTTLVPSKSMHYVMQTETRLSGGAPADSSVGEIEVDWVAIWAKN